MSGKSNFEIFLRKVFFIKSQISIYEGQKSEVYELGKYLEGVKQMKI
jgi:hypothetical protein